MTEPEIERREAPSSAGPVVGASAAAEPGSCVIDPRTAR